VVSAVLDAPSESERNADTLALLDYGIGEFQRITAAPVGTGVDVSVPIRYRRGAELELVIGSNGQRTVVPRGERERVMSYRALKYPPEVEGPIAYGSRLGSAEVLQDGERIAVVPLVAARQVPAADLAQRTKSWFTTPIGVILGFAVLSGTVLVMRRARRPGRSSRRRLPEEASVG
jgi:D-alanyl-D-alanine carboxypeptidase